MKSLFDKTTLNGVTLHNRCIRSATREGMADEKGHLKETHETIYENLAAGGIGLIIAGMAEVLGPSPHTLGIYDDSFIAEYANLTSAVHKHDTPIVIQLAYLGSQGGPRVAGGRLWGVSAVEHRSTGVTPKEMTRDNIQVLVASFAEAARRAKEAGFDGVQLHAAHGYFLNQSLCTYYNRRIDEYGGTIQNRARVLYEVCTAVRKAVGDEYLLMAKVNGEDLFEGGLTLEESIVVCHGLEERGIDAIEVSGGHGPQKGEEHGIIRTGLKNPKEQSYFADQATKVAEQLDVPVALVGGNREPKLLEDILNTTDIEYVTFCRPLIREPHLMRRWQSGDFTSARCTSCNWCYDNMKRGEDLACKFEKD